MKTFLIIAVLLIGIFIYAFGNSKQGQAPRTIVDNPERVGKQFKFVGFLTVLIGIALLWTQSFIAGSIVTVLALLVGGLNNVNSYYIRSKLFFDIYKSTKVHDPQNNEYMVQYVSVQEYLRRNKKILFSHQSIINGIFEDKSAIDLKKLAYTLLTSEDIYTRNYNADVSGNFSVAQRESRMKDTGIDKAYSKAFGNRPAHTKQQP